MTKLVQPGASAQSRSGARLYRRLLQQVTHAGLATGQEGEPVTEAEVSSLPEAAQRYLRFMGVIGRPRDWSFRAYFVGHFRMRPFGRWTPAETWQYTSAVEIARIFVMRLRLGHVLPTIGRDTYLHGHGRMLGKMLGLMPVVAGQGEEYDSGELVIYLDEALLLAPSMLLSPAVTWTAVDDNSFDVALTDRGRTAAVRVFLDDRGAPVDLRTDRYASLPSGMVLAPWRTTVESWDVVGGRPVPGPTAAIYELPDGPDRYFEGRFVPGSVVYNVTPGT